MLFELEGTEKEIKEADKEAKLIEKLIKFCIKHFEDYRPDPNDCRKTTNNGQKTHLFFKKAVKTLEGF